VRAPVPLADAALSHQQHQDQQSGEFEYVQNESQPQNFFLLQVVDTSQLIKDERDIFSTEKVACMLKVCANNSIRVTQ
jgi:hypothetical protein